MLNAGASMAEIAAILGHDSVATTSRLYARYDVRGIRAAFDRYALPLEQVLGEQR